MKTFVKVYNFFTAPSDEEEGASMVEYGLLVGLIAVASVLVIGFLGTGIRDLFQTVLDALP